VMLELRASIVAINTAPTNLAANELGFVGSRGSEFPIIVRPCHVAFGHTVEF